MSADRMAFDTVHARRVDLAPEASSPSAARALVAAWCREWALDAGVTDTARLVVSELTTNVLLHARTPMVLMADLESQMLLLTVVDGDAARPSVRRADLDAEGGRGLAMIEAMGGRLEIRPTPVGKAVVCSLPLHGVVEQGGAGAPRRDRSGGVAEGGVGGGSSVAGAQAC